MKILGIDPGVATVGFGLLETSGTQQRILSCGVITTPAHTPLSSRLDRIYSDLEELIRSCDPEAISIEELFFSKNITTGIPVAHARGVILLCAFRCGVPVYEYTPMQVKQAVVGYGRAEKMQVMLMTQRLLNLPKLPRPDDAADALAIAICHGNSMNMRNLKIKV